MLVLEIDFDKIRSISLFSIIRAIWLQMKIIMLIIIIILDDPAIYTKEVSDFSTKNVKPMMVENEIKEVKISRIEMNNLLRIEVRKRYLIIAFINYVNFSMIIK